VELAAVCIFPLPIGACDGYFKSLGTVCSRSQGEILCVAGIVLDFDADALLLVDYAGSPTIGNSIITRVYGQF
jgi:hypothetical protein